MSSMPRDQFDQLMEGRDAAGRIAARAEYRAKTGRDFPQVYRLRITVEAEALSEDEARAYWQVRVLKERAHDAVGREQEPS